MQRVSAEPAAANQHFAAHFDAETLHFSQLHIDTFYLADCINVCSE